MQMNTYKIKMSWGSGDTEYVIVAKSLESAMLEACKLFGEKKNCAIDTTFISRIENMGHFVDAVEGIV